MRTIRDAEVSGKRVLVRVDFNVPLKGGTVGDDKRIRAALPTLRALLRAGARLVLMSHCGRPKGRRNEALSLRPMAARLQELIGQPVACADDCIGAAVEQQVAEMPANGILLLENVRFHPGETANDPSFARQLAALGDIFVNDAFGSVHRAHASTEGVAHLLPAYAGELIATEVGYLGGLLRGVQSSAERGLLLIIGGAKVSSKIAVLESLLPKCSLLAIGGGMAYTFLKAGGHSVGASLVEDGYLRTAGELLAKARDSGVITLLPQDHIVAQQFSADAAAEQIAAPDIPAAAIGMDIGPATRQQLAEAIAGAYAPVHTVLWNGPLGVFEFEQFANGTLEVARMVADATATTIVGGGDSIAALNRFGLADRIDHVSTGGGAMLEFLEKGALPGLAVLEA